MTAAIIGISSGLLIILSIALVKSLDKSIMYSLILTGIAFLYVGFTWTDIPSLIINSLQAIFFVLLSFYGIRKNFSFLIAGYFLHGLWDIVYSYFQLTDLRPPHYDLFCLSIDFTIGLYLVVLTNWQTSKINNSNESIK